MSGDRPPALERRETMSKTTTDTAAKIVWFELPADDTVRARGFYGKLFGWHFQPMDGPSEYHMTYEGGGAIYPGEGSRGVLVYFGVPDIDASLGRVGELGGEAGEVTEMPGIGRYAVCTDSEGNTFGLYQGAS
jgi:predicted enzyme related to lactoylglutathione lyase